jgi:hypothetical protein
MITYSRLQFNSRCDKEQKKEEKKRKLLTLNSIKSLIEFILE